MTAYTRRNIIGTAAGGSATRAMPSIVRAHLKIGTVVPRQGPMSRNGQAASQTSRIAIDQVGGRVQDRPVELVVYDDAGAEGAQTDMRKLIDVDKVAAVVGGQSSSTGLAMAAVAAQAKVPTVLSVPIVKEITGKNCDSHGFRCQATSETYAGVLDRYTLPIGKRWKGLPPERSQGDSYWKIRFPSRCVVRTRSNATGRPAGRSIDLGRWN